MLEIRDHHGTAYSEGEFLLDVCRQSDRFSCVTGVCSWFWRTSGTPEAVGRFALGLAITTPIILFANLQLRAIQATDVRSEYLFRDYLGLRVLMLSLGLLMILGRRSFHPINGNSR